MQLVHKTLSWYVKPVIGTHFRYKIRSKNKIRDLWVARRKPCSNGRENHSMVFTNIQHDTDLGSQNTFYPIFSVFQPNSVLFSRKLAVKTQLFSGFQSKKIISGDFKNHTMEFSLPHSCGFCIGTGQTCAIFALLARLNALEFTIFGLHQRSAADF